MLTRYRSLSLARRIAVTFGAAALLLALGVTGSASAQAATGCAPDSGPNFAGTSPTVRQLNQSDLRCADFQNAKLNNLSFEQADLTSADFRHATMTNDDFSQATLTDANFTDATLTSTSFEQATMRGVTLTGIDANKSSFEQVDLSGVSLAGAQLVDADFSQAELKKADLAGANLRGASLDQADISSANLRGANLAGADLSEATTTAAKTDGILGLPPLDLFGAILTLIVSLLTLLPRLAATGRGRAGAWLVVALFAVVTAVEAVAAAGWRPMIEQTLVLPFLTPVIFLALYVGRIVRRPGPGWPAAGVALVALSGFLLLVTAGLAFITDNLFGIFPFADTCSSATCGYGISRAPLGIIIGVILIAASAVISRFKSIAKPGPDLAKWNAMQASGGADLAAAASATFPAAGPMASGSPGATPTHEQPPNQTI